MQPRVQHSEIVASAHGCLVVARRAAPPAVSARGLGGRPAAAPGARGDQAIECAAPIASQLMVVFVVGFVDVGGVSRCRSELETMAWSGAAVRPAPSRFLQSLCISAGFSALVASSGARTFVKEAVPLLLRC